MTINVIDFYREKEKGETHNPFVCSFHQPSFCIVADVDRRKKELVLKLSGDVECPTIVGLKDFELESYRNYIIITDFLLGENRERLRQSWELSKEDFRELFFELYFCLLRKYAKCGLFKKVFLLAVGLWKFFIGRKLR